jgi:hypothetical protein
MGGAKDVKPTKKSSIKNAPASKEFKMQVALQAIRDNTANVNQDAKTLSLVQKVEASATLFMNEVESLGAVQGFYNQFHRIELGGIEKILAVLENKKLGGNIDYKMEKVVCEIFGEFAIRVNDLADSLVAVKESCTSVLLYALTKASVQVEKFSITTLIEVLKAVKNQKIGAANSSSSSNIDVLTSALEQARIG